MQGVFGGKVDEKTIENKEEAGQAAPAEREVIEAKN